MPKMPCAVSRKKSAAQPRKSYARPLKRKKQRFGPPKRRYAPLKPPPLLRRQCLPLLIQPHRASSPPPRPFAALTPHRRRKRVRLPVAQLLRPFAVAVKTKPKIVPLPAVRRLVAASYAPNRQSLLPRVRKRKTNAAAAS